MARDDDSTLLIERATFLHQTEDAVLIEFEGKDVWVPFSQTSIFNPVASSLVDYLKRHEYRKGDTMPDFEVKEWWANRAGLI